MIREILAEMQRGSTTVRMLSRKLGIEESALEGMLRYMVRKGLVRELHPECRSEGCLGCPCHGKCQNVPVIGYEIAARQTALAVFELEGRWIRHAR